MTATPPAADASPPSQPRPLSPRLEPAEDDVFISYSRADRAFATRLYERLQRYRPPRGLPVPQRRLRAFLDVHDIRGNQLDEALTRHLDQSARLVVLCSPNSARSVHVAGEIRHFAGSSDPRAIIPVLVSGHPNDEAPEEEERAFSAALLELGNPLAVPYRGFDPGRDRVDRGRFRAAWFQLLANIYGVPQRELEQCEKARTRRRMMTAAAAVLLTGAAAGGWSMYTRTDGYQLQKAVESGAALVAPAGDSAVAEFHRALILSGRGDNAVQAVRAIGSAESRDEELALLAAALVQVGDPDDARPVVRAIGNPALKTRALLSVSEALAARGQIARAETAARAVPSADDRALALSRIAGAWAAAGQLDHAQRVAREIEGSRPAAETWAAVVEALVRAGRTDEAIQVGRRMTSTPREGAALGLTAGVLAGAGRLEDARAIAGAIYNLEERALALASIGQALARAGRPDDAIRIAREAPPMEERPSPNGTGVAGLVAGALARAEHADHAFLLAREGRTAYDRAAILLYVAGELAASGQAARVPAVIRAAEAEARNVPGPLARVALLRAAGETYLRAGRTEEGLGLLREAHRRIQAAELDGRDDWQDWQQELEAVAVAMARAGRRQEATAAAEATDDTEARAAIRRAVAEHFVRTGDVQQARAAATGIYSDNGHGAHALSAVAIALARGGRTREAVALAVEADTLAHDVENEDNKGAAYTSVARALAYAGEFRRAREVAARTELSNDERLRVYTAMLEVHGRLQANPAWRARASAAARADTGIVALPEQARRDAAGTVQSRDRDGAHIH